MREGNKEAALLLNFQREPENFYLTVLLGNTIANGVFAIVLVLMLKEISSGALFWSLFLLCIFSLLRFATYFRKSCLADSPTNSALLLLDLFEPFSLHSLRS